jgi:hypothetical protein
MQGNQQLVWNVTDIVQETGSSFDFDALIVLNRPVGHMRNLLTRLWKKCMIFSKRLESQGKSL